MTFVSALLTPTKLKKYIINIFSSPLAALHVRPGAGRRLRPARRQRREHHRGAVRCRRHDRRREPPGRPGNAGTAAAQEEAAAARLNDEVFPLVNAT